jgi:hypothetical protein
MRLSYGGSYKNEDQLPVATLPENAIRFREPETPAMLNLAALAFVPPVLALVALFVALAYWIHGEVTIQFGFGSLLLGGFLLPFLAFLPHELLHAVCFGKDAEVKLFISVKNMLLFVVSTQPVSKARFIFLSLLPNLALGWIPLLVWAVIPYRGAGTENLLFFSVISALGGVGDYLNVFNAARQMPKGSMQQLSGFHSFWYMP